jgi:Uma2 family endonuclease
MVQAPPKASIHIPDNLQIHPARTWEQFKLIQKGLEDLSGVHLFFFQGTVEILMPGREHELFKKIIAILIETFLLDRNVDFIPTGSADYESVGVASAQPDESYEIGDHKLAIEITVTSGTIQKLELYKALGVHEVWFWEDGTLQLHHLIDGNYQQVDQSQIPDLATLNVAVLIRCILMGETSRTQAIEALRLAHAGHDKSIY